MKKGIEYITGRTKRSLDLFGGLAAAMGMAPVTAAVGLVAAVDTHSTHPLFRQERLGQAGRAITALKFRTIAEAAMSDVTYGTFDPRATAVGQLLRQTGLDELPQIFNVINGSMSLVGARPMLEEDIDFMERAAPDLFDEWHAYYLAARPGLVGASQVYRHHFRDGKDKAIYRQSAELDLRYFETATLAGDLAIIAATPFTMFRTNLGVVNNQGTTDI